MHLASIADLLNCTWSGLLYLLLTLFVVNATKILGRQHEKNVVRTPFSWRVWFSDWVNWFTLLVNLVSSVLLLGIRESLAPALGLSVVDHDTFELFFAVIVGIVGQVLWVRLLTMVAAIANGSPSGGNDGSR